MREIKALYDRIAQLEHIVHQTTRHGIVRERDAKKHRLRLELADKNGKKFLSPWIPYSQIAGTRKVHSVPSINQTVTLFAPGGDWQQAQVLPLTWSKKNPAPSEDGDEDVDLRGKSRWTQRDASVVRQVDGLTVSHTKQSHSLTVHKDPENKEEGKDEEVSDEKPWKGNRAKKKHTRIINKDGGYQLTINEGDNEKEHKIFVKPGDDAVEISTHKGKHKITIKKDDVKISAHNGQHETTYESSGIKHKSSSKVTVEAPQIQHQGDVQVSGSIFSQGVVQSGAGFNGPVGNMSPGDPGSATTW